MKNLLILIVSIALFLHFYPQPEVEKQLIQLKETALTIFADATDTSVRLKSDKILMDLQSELDRFSTDEVERLKEITATHKTVTAFYYKHCQEKTSPTIFHGTNLAKVCKTIGNYSAFF
jgi:hypothetical protein